MSFHCGAVSSKISCLFRTKVVTDCQSTKRCDQSYMVIASDELRSDAAESLQQPSCVATEKLDGTCVLILLYYDKPWIWARHDRKPHKVAEKQFKKYKQSYL